MNMPANTIYVHIGCVMNNLYLYKFYDHQEELEREKRKSWFAPKSER